MLSRIIMGARYTFGISLGGRFIACSSGVMLGMIAAVTGGWLDAALSRFMDAMNSIPSKLFGLVVVAAVGSSIPALILTLAVDLHSRRLSLCPLARRQHQHDGLHHRRPHPRRKHLLSHLLRNPAQHHPARCWPISACALSSSCCCFQAFHSLDLACSHRLPTGARWCTKTSAACPSHPQPLSCLRWQLPASPSASTC